MPDGLYADVIQKHGFVPSNHSHAQWFPVSAGEVYDADGKPIAGYQRIFRTDSGDNLALHSADYKLVPYEENFRRFEEAIQNSGLDTTDLQIATDMTHNGGRVFRQYLFPAHRRSIKGADEVALRIIMFDSYDGTYSFRGMAGHFRFVCANTAVIGDSIIELRAKHVANFDQRSAGLIKAIVKSAERYEAEIDRMRLYAEIGLPVAKFRGVIDEMPQATEALQDKLVATYAVKHGDAGTAWDAYNVLTHWATHEDGGKHAAQTKAQREARVLALTNSKTWKELTNA